MTGYNLSSLSSRHPPLSSRALVETSLSLCHPERSRDISFPLSSRAWPRDLSTSVEMTLALLVISSLTLNVISTKRSAWRDLYCVTNTLQLPSFSPRSTYFCSISLSSSFCMAAMLMPVSSLISASVSVGCVRIAFRIFV